MSGEANEILWRGVRPVAGIRGVWPAIDAERVDITKGRSSEGTEIAYTVPANKKLFVASVFLSTAYSGAISAWVNVLLRDGDDDTVYYIYSLKYLTAGQQSNSMFFIPALEAEAGWDVVLYNSSDDLGATVIFHGWLEDA